MNNNLLVLRVGNWHTEDLSRAVMHGCNLCLHANSIVHRSHLKPRLKLQITGFDIYTKIFTVRNELEVKIYSL